MRLCRCFGSCETGRFFMFWVFVLFIIISSFMVLNMLIGVLCEQVSITAAEEGDKLVVGKVTEQMTQVYQAVDTNGNGMISEREFRRMSAETDAQAALLSLGVEPKHFWALQDVLFVNASDGQLRELEFTEFIRLVCHMRPGTAANVLDIAQLRRQLRDSEARIVTSLRDLYAIVRHPESSWEHESGD
mmetsp:Transcript_12311/g.27263  ORF Transcript_12311/g.27263 Transcript_12311/m.27263 type:complete len:188 (+) Transcript_12311:925-1488(+)